MTWQEHVNTLIATQNVTNVAILGQKGGIWAISKSYSLSAEDQKTITSIFDKIDDVPTNGAHIAGKKYFCIAADLRAVHLKQRADGYVLFKTKQAILVAEYTHPIQGQQCYDVVEKAAEYLEGLGF